MLVLYWFLYKTVTHFFSLTKTKHFSLSSPLVKKRTKKNNLYPDLFSGLKSLFPFPSLFPRSISCLFQGTFSFDFIWIITFTYKLSDISILEAFFNVFPPIVSFLKNGRADALRERGDLGVFWKVFRGEENFSLVLSFRKGGYLITW